MEPIINLNTILYKDQVCSWPVRGKHILANYDHESIIVYQAYSHVIGKFAEKHGFFGGDFSYNRMSWIKPNFLWMMYRSGWASKPGQEIVLAIRLRRSFFEEILLQAVPSTYGGRLFADRDEWKIALAKSNVRLQWDPDHDPYGNKLDRRAIQLGLRGEILQRYGNDEILQIINISEFVCRQKIKIDNKSLNKLKMPKETVYIPIDRESSIRIGLDNAE